MWIVFLILFNATPSMAAPWTIEKLEGKRSLHDGPNCFNAALVAKGYLDYVAHTVEEEMRYFLAHFCSQKKVRPTAGDLMLQGNEESFGHAALSLGGQAIFEKDATTGQYGAYSPSGRYGKISSVNIDRTSLYSSRSWQDSGFFYNEGQCEGNCRYTNVYQCPDAAVVKTKMADIFRHPSVRGIRQINLELETLMFDRRSLQLSSNPELFRRIKTLVDRIQLIDGKTSADTYILAASLSLENYLFLLQEEQDFNEEWKNMKSSLAEANFAARERILDVNPSDKKWFILQTRDATEEAAVRMKYVPSPSPRPTDALSTKTRL